MSNIKINVRKENGQYKTESTCVEVSGVNGSENTIAPVFMKDSLGPIVGEENMLRELPWG